MIELRVEGGINVMVKVGPLSPRSTVKCWIRVEIEPTGGSGSRCYSSVHILKDNFRWCYTCSPFSNREDAPRQLEKAKKVAKSGIPKRDGQ